MKPSDVQLDLATGLRARIEGETADQGAQVLAKLKLACRDPATGGASPVRTVRPICDVPLDVMRDCRRRREPFPDPHDWQDAPGAERATPGGEVARRWLRCARCGDWMPKTPKETP